MVIASWKWAIALHVLIHYELLCNDKYAPLTTIAECHVYVLQWKTLKKTYRKWWEVEKQNDYLCHDEE